jgi:hypothetical protein
MKVAFVRILEVTGLPSLNCSQVFVRLLPSNQGSYGALSGRDVVKCDSCWNFVYADRSQNSVAFSFQVTGQTKQDLARVTLPFSWFPPNCIVASEYPCRCVVPGAAAIPMAKLQIHLSENGAPGFHAPPGRLLVRLASRTPPQQSYAYPYPYPYPVPKAQSYNP